MSTNGAAQLFQVGDAVAWQDREGRNYQGYVAAFLRKGEPIPVWFTENQRTPSGRRFKQKQLVARRDDRYIVDCGVGVVGEDEDGAPIRDVVYRCVPIWNRTLRALPTPYPR